jgi:DNA end-binding protein Ku
MERVCQTDGKPVAWQDLVKGYEIAPGQFVTVTEDDFKTAALERSRSIDILGFVPLRDIDARYWDTPYVAVPGKGAEHSYALLAEALDKSARVGIAKYVMRQRQHLAGLVSIDGRLVVSTMRFPEDLVAMPDAPKRPKLASRELDLAAQLIEGMAQPWQPERYADDYVPALMKVIEAKAEGTPIRKKEGKAQPATNVTDLVARLRESLAAAGRSGTGAEPRKVAASSSRPTAKRGAAAKQGTTKRAAPRRPAAKPRKRVA